MLFRYVKVACHFWTYFKTYQQIKNPLSASGQAPVASDSVGAFPVRVALRAVAREKTACSLACSALRAEWNIGKSECREQRVYCFQDHTGATAIRRRVARNLC